MILKVQISSLAADPRSTLFSCQVAHLARWAGTKKDHRNGSEGCDRCERQGAEAPESADSSINGPIGLGVPSTK